MPNSDVVAADHVLIRCPACGATEAADPVVLIDSPMIVCRNCGETWPSSPRRRARRLSAELDRDPVRQAAAHLPVVAGEGDAGRAWAAKMAADVPAPAPRRSRAPLVAAAVVAAAFLAAFFGGRERAVALVPDLADLYASVGLPVNLDRLVLEHVAAERSTAEDGTRLTVRGAIRNVSADAQPVPPLSLSFRDGAGAPAGWRGFDPPSGSIGPGRAEPFVLQIYDAPPQAADIVLRFRRAAENGSSAAQDRIPAP